MRQQRAAFTLVEMLVATALVLFIMVLMAQAFTSGLEAFRQLKAVGDMEGRLRIATSLLRRDLQADHFEGRKRLSDAKFFAESPPREGFFRIQQGRANEPAFFLENQDGDGVGSSRATNHILHFTVKQRGNNRQDFFFADISNDRDAYRPVPPGPTWGWALSGRPDARYQENNYLGNPPTGTYSSQWAEVMYFLRPNGTTAAGTPLYTLYRRQRLAVPDNDKVNWDSAWQRPSAAYTDSAAGQAYAEISCYPRAPQQGNVIYFNNPTDLTIPQRRFGMSLTQDGGVPQPRLGGWPPVLGDPDEPQFRALQGSDLLLEDVISFEIQVLDMSQHPPDFVYLPPGRNPLFQGDVHVFDTWTSVHDDTYDYSAWDDTDPNSPLAIQRKRIPLKVSIPALKVTLRVWDHATQRTRQVTMIIDM